MKRVLIADDLFIVRKGLKTVLLEHFPNFGIGEAEHGQSVINAILSGRWDILLLDIRMPGREVLDTLKHVKQVRPDLPSIVLSMHTEDHVAIRVLNAGACAYIRHDNAGADLVKAVEHALLGQRYTPPSVAEMLATYRPPG